MFLNPFKFSLPDEGYLPIDRAGARVEPRRTADLRENESFASAAAAAAAGAGRGQHGIGPAAFGPVHRSDMQTSHFGSAVTACVAEPLERLERIRQSSSAQSLPIVTDYFNIRPIDGVLITTTM